MNTDIEIIRKKLKDTYGWEDNEITHYKDNIYVIKVEVLIGYFKDLYAVVSNNECELKLSI